MDKKLIINADDFGLCKGQNYGIIEAFNHGIVRSTTAMVNADASMHAVSLSRANPDLAVGLHFVLTANKPLSNALTLVDEQGNLGKFLWERLPEFNAQMQQDIEQELQAQYAKFVELYSRAPTHIDSHHHIHFHPNIYPIVESFALAHQLPLRTSAVDLDNVVDINANLVTTQAFSDEFYGDSISKELLIEILLSPKYEQAESLEIMCHPALVDHTLLKSNYCYPRLDELNVFTEKGLEQELLGYSYRLASFADL